jgi:Type II secretory pathway, component ExeA (predicted ATPase)
MAAKGRLNPFGDSSKNFVFFPSLSHKKGVHRIVRGLESNCGLILLTGEIGIGKTSLARHIQAYLSDRFVFVELGNPYQTPLEQVFFCCERFGLDTAGLSSIHDCIGRLERHFHAILEEGKRPVIVFDESHLLTKRHLSLIHILSNLRADDGPLVQILLVGQLEILELLATEGMEALNQRIGVRCQLAPLVLDDTDKYIHFKLEKSGRPGMMEFSREAVERIWKESSGLPRLINHVCAHALDALAFKDSKVVTPEMVDEVCRESVYTGMFQAKTRKQRERHWPVWIMGGAATAALVVLAVFLLVRAFGPEPAATIRQPVGIVEGGQAGQGAPQADEGTPAAGADGNTAWQYKESVPSGKAAATAPEQSREADRDVDTQAGPGEDMPPEVVIVVDRPGPDKAGQEDRLPEANGTGAFPRTAPNPEDVLDGNAHPVIGQLVVGAVAWNENPAHSVAVVNSTLLHEGDFVDGVRLLNIGQDQLLFEYEGVYYHLTFSR